MSTNVRYATILTEESDDLRIRYIANKHIFQNFDNAASYNPAYLSNIISIDNNTSVLSVYNSWVGVGATTPTDINNLFQVNSYTGNTQFVVGAGGVGINTSTVTDAPNVFSVYGSGYFSDSVGIGTNLATEKLRVDGNVQAFLFRARGADYAELEELDDSVVDIPADGKMIGFNDKGKVVLAYSNSIHFGIVSHKPSLIGNEKILDEIEKQRCIPIVYIGKVEVSLDKHVEIGDYIIPCKNGQDEIGIRTVSKKDIAFSDFIQAIGYIHRHISSTIYEVIVRI